MVTAADLMLSASDVHKLCSKVWLEDSDEAQIDYFAAMAWSVICEPGDAFAGQLVATFGASRALALELGKISAAEYVRRFSDAGSDWVEMQMFGRFERTLADARERWSPRFSMARVSSAVDTMADLSGWFITEQSDRWPDSLNDLENHSPRGLWGIGQPPAITGRSLAIVGSRMATSYGEQVTVELIAPLVKAGNSVISGGAYGIDAQAHRATLALGGETIAIMAGGLDRLYPSGNRELFRKIAEKGSIVSELPPGAEPTKWRFLQRNRLIAALGQATLVIEAAARSGAVSTANRAVDLGRPVGAVPGHINSPGSDGCHQLIRDGKAELITCSAEIFELLGENASLTESSGLGALETRALDVIGLSSANLSKICSEGGLTRSEAELGLAGLSLLGLIEQDSLGWRRKL